MPTASVQFDCPQGRFQIERYPQRKLESLQAWTSADRLLLEAASKLGLSAGDTLVVNDDHGALCAGLQPLVLWTDSWLSAESTRRNLAANGLPPVPVRWSTDDPPASACTVLRIPKSLPFFEYQLARLAATRPEGSLLLAAGMDKHLSPNTASIIERWFGPTQRQPGRHKARVFVAERSAEPAPQPPALAEYGVPTLPFPLHAQSNVFSADRVDHGTRLLLSVLEREPPVSQAVDLACGNGIVGLHLLQWQLAASVLFADESAMAIASARSNLPPEWQAKAWFHHGDGLQDSDVRAELVLLNPPFHLGHVVDEYAGRRLIRQAHDVLLPGGRLLLVFNSHLKYRTLLRKLFVRTRELARDRKFSVVLAERA